MKTKLRHNWQGGKKCTVCGLEVYKCKETNRLGQLEWKHYYHKEGEIVYNEGCTLINTENDQLKLW